MAVVAYWITDLQYTNPGLRSYGAVKVHHTVSAIAADGTQYYRVSPYLSNLGVLGLLCTSIPNRVLIAERWIKWYAFHLTPDSAPDGVPYEHFYLADGSGETTCVKPGDHFLCHYNDATDSAAATFFSVLWAYYEAGGRTAFDAPELKPQIETLATVLLSLQQADGLCWAKADYRAKYLEDNSEVYAGLRALANLEEVAFKDKVHAQNYAEAASRVQHGIMTELYDAQTKLYHPAKFEDGKLSAANLNVWFPDTQSQLWPQLFGVVAPTDPKAQATLNNFNHYWNGKVKPDWATTPHLAAGGWIAVDVAYAAWLAGDTKRVATYLAAVKRLKFPVSAQDTGFAWPFTVADAGWLLQLMAAKQKVETLVPHQ
ncbi:MAG: hypothetical protein JO316_09720 [Abitibacteriaceae bacterium]|nr:hypothetical protein [Abditibacteriaceae bacterium]